MGPSDGNLVGIIGAGRLGQAMARTARRAGRDVVIANSRGPESLTAVVSALGEGVSAGTGGEAATAGIVVIAVPWDRVPEAVQGLEWNSQIVIDATNDWAADESPRENVERVRRRPCCRRAARQGGQHAHRRGARLGSARGRRPARDLRLRRRRRRESGGRRAVPGRGIRRDRPRRPRNGTARCSRFTTRSPAST
jgi:NADP oxidoreductase coenzyme F420-dependent